MFILELWFCVYIHMENDVVILRFRHIQKLQFVMWRKTPPGNEITNLANFINRKHSLRQSLVCDP